MEDMRREDEQITSEDDGVSTEINPLEDIPDEVLESLAPDPEDIFRRFSLSMMGGSFGPELTKEHISDLIEQSGRESELGFEERKQQRLIIFGFASLLLLVAVAILVFLVLLDSKDLLLELIKAVGFLATGLVGGYGWGSRRRD